MLKCAVLDDYQGVAPRMADWSALKGEVAVRFHTRHYETADELAAAIGDDEIVVAMRERTPFPDALFDRLPKLRLLVTTAMGNAAIDMASARRHGITVAGTGGLAYSPATAELTWALILALVRHLADENRSLRDGGPWQSHIGEGLYGKRLGILGLGRIGSQVARYGQAFGMEVSAWSRNLTTERSKAAGVSLAPTLGDLLATSDVVTIHLVLSSRTRGLIGAKELSLMKPSAYLVNTSRGPIVERNALLDALKTEKIRGAGLDVFDTEPLPADDPFRTLSNVLATPHIGYVTEETYRTWYADAVEDIQAYLAGRPVRVLSP